MRLNFSATKDEMEQAAGAMLTVANVAADNGEIYKAAFYEGASRGVEQLLEGGKPEDAGLRLRRFWHEFERNYLG